MQGHSNTLPDNVIMFLRHRMNVSQQEVAQLWTRFQMHMDGGDLDKFDHFITSISSSAASVMSLRELNLREYKSCFRCPYH